MPAVLLHQRLGEQVRQITDGRGAMLGGRPRVQLTRRAGQLPEVRPRAQLPSRIERQ